MENLLFGSAGDDVRRLQERLKEFGFYEAEINGYFDENTEAGVRAFQNSEGLAADGLVGLMTLHALDLLSPEAVSGDRENFRRNQNA
jgi:peptidoglycan hydrolase-like protein with peptidoglycan-binding domain